MVRIVVSPVTGEPVQLPWARLGDFLDVLAAAGTDDIVKAYPKGSAAHQLDDKYGRLAAWLWQAGLQDRVFYLAAETLAGARGRQNRAGQPKIGLEEFVGEVCRSLPSAFTDEDVTLAEFQASLREGIQSRLGDDLTQ